MSVPISARMRFCSAWVDARNTIQQGDGLGPGQRSSRALLVRRLPCCGLHPHHLCLCASRCRCTSFGRSHALLTLPADTPDGFFAHSNQDQLLREPEPKVRLERTNQGFFQLGSLCLQSPACQVGQHSRIGFSGQQGFSDRASRLAQHSAHPVSQFEMGVFQRLLEPIDGTCPLLDQIRSVTCQLAQLSLHRGWNEAACE